jgi:hypothetical protein
MIRGGSFVFLLPELEHMPEAPYPFATTHDDLPWMPSLKHPLYLNNPDGKELATHLMEMNRRYGCPS